MRVLLDTNIIIRAAQPNQPTWPEINQALTGLHRNEETVPLDRI